MKTKPDFTTIPFESKPAPVTYKDWSRTVKAETGHTVGDWARKTLEQIDLKPLYGTADLAKCEGLDTMPGLPPFRRGPYGSMYVVRPWTVRQYAGRGQGRRGHQFH
jgi:methylmalonyl-CoA mutase